MCIIIEEYISESNGRDMSAEPWDKLPCATEAKFSLLFSHIELPLLARIVTFSIAFSWENDSIAFPCTFFPGPNNNFAKKVL